MPESLRTLRRKIRTVRNIEHITRAMQFVATAKLQRLQRLTTSGRAYAERLQELLERVAAVQGESEHPYLVQRPVQRVGLVLMAGDRGLCGAFNQQLLRRADDLVSHLRQPVVVVTIGQRATRWAARRSLESAGSFPALADLGRGSGALELCRTVRGLYESGRVDRVQVIHEDFQSILRHHPATTQLLPLTAEATHAEAGVYGFEPPAPELLAALLPQAVDALLLHLALATHTSEQAARMTAMRAATDNAGEMMTLLTRRLNRARQTQITSEIMDVVGGASALGAV